MDVMVADLIDVVQENSQEDDRKAKKPMQGEEEDSKEGSDEEDRESEESDKESEEDSEGREEISMPKESCAMRGQAGDICIHRPALPKSRPGLGKTNVH